MIRSSTTLACDSNKRNIFKSLRVCLAVFTMDLEKKKFLIFTERAKFIFDEPKDKTLLMIIMAARSS